VRVDDSHHFVITDLERLKPSTVDSLLRFALRGSS
jgi:hypothetical protein